MRRAYLIRLIVTGALLAGAIFLAIDLLQRGQ